MEDSGYDSTQKSPGVIYLRPVTMNVDEAVFQISHDFVDMSGSVEMTKAVTDGGGKSSTADWK